MRQKDFVVVAKVNTHISHADNGHCNLFNLGNLITAYTEKVIGVHQLFIEMKFHDIDTRLQGNLGSLCLTIRATITPLHYPLTTHM